MATLNYQLYRRRRRKSTRPCFSAATTRAARSLTYSNAGHLPPIVICGDGRVQRLEYSGTVVGLFDGVAIESRLPMHPGDIFVAFSDGVTEPENEFGEFGEERLIELIRANRDQPLARISETRDRRGGRLDRRQRAA